MSSLIEKPKESEHLKINLETNLKMDGIFYLKFVNPDKEVFWYKINNFLSVYDRPIRDVIIEILNKSKDLDNTDYSIQDNEPTAKELKASNGDKIQTYDEFKDNLSNYRYLHEELSDEPEVFWVRNVYKTGSYGLCELRDYDVNSDKSLKYKILCIITDHKEKLTKKGVTYIISGEKPSKEEYDTYSRGFNSYEDLKESLCGDILDLE